MTTDKLTTTTPKPAPTSADKSLIRGLAPIIFIFTLVVGSMILNVWCGVSRPVLSGLWFGMPIGIIFGAIGRWSDNK